MGSFDFNLFVIKYSKYQVRGHFMKLSELLTYNSIYIQCHDTPDADALASAYGLYLYFKSHNKNAYIVYGGRNQITKPNLELMISTLKIPVNYLPNDPDKFDGLLITVDCQYGQGNVTPLSADYVACIDHHQPYTTIPMQDIRPYLGSCSTLVWKLLTDEGFDVLGNKLLSTALYYGLMTDTSNFVESLHPLDRDMQDTLVYDRNLITRFVNSNISIKELEIAGIALIRHIYNDDHRFAVVHSEACDPNILGLISDLVVQVDKIDTCVVYNNADGGFKLSVRSCIKEVRANELVEYLTAQIGSGGGHTDKAGGFIFENMYESLYPTINTETYFGLRMTKYFDETELVYAKDYSVDVSSMSKYKKIDNTMGCFIPDEYYPIGAKLTLRTVDNDISFAVDGISVVIIDSDGNVSCISKDKYQNDYNISSNPFDCPAKYMPTVKSNKDTSRLLLEQCITSCVPKEESTYLIKELDNDMKIFTLDNEDTYVLGLKGDYLACKESTPKDIFIIKHDSFNSEYTAC